jgi:hypothetical protein
MDWEQEMEEREATFAANLQAVGIGIDSKYRLTEVFARNSSDMIDYLYDRLQQLVGFSARLDRAHCASTLSYQLNDS